MNHIPIDCGKVEGIVMFLIVRGRALIDVTSLCPTSPEKAILPAMGRKITQ